MRILIVDDESVSLEKLKLIVSAFGDCDCVDNAGKALELFASAVEKSAEYGLVLLDIKLPDMQGNDLLIQMREAEQRTDGAKRAKIVMVTSCVAKDTVIDCRANGCDDYIIKPFNQGVIVKKLSALGLIPQQPSA